MHRPLIDRNVGEIATSLRATLRELITGSSPWPLYLFGPAGVGKTCAALCLLDYSGGAYWTQDSLMDRIISVGAGRITVVMSQYAGSMVQSTEGFWRQQQREPLVVLDEIGCRDRVRDFAFNSVKTLIDVRENLPLIVVSNLDLAAIERLYDERIASRLGSGTVCELAGEDRRLKR
jgi:DNA replication protein DnaC